jgi:exonuclease VII large subunit
VAEFLLGKFLELDMEITSLSGRLTGKVTQLLNEKKYFISDCLKNLPVMVRNNLRHTASHLNSTGSLLAVTAFNFIRHNRQNLSSGNSRFGFAVKNHIQRLRTIEQDTKRRILPDNIKNMIRKNSDRLLLYHTTIGLVDPENLLKKGYAMILKNDRIVKSVNDLNYNDIMVTKLLDGRIESKVLKVNKNHPER